MTDPAARLSDRLRIAEATRELAAAAQAVTEASAATSPAPSAAAEAESLAKAIEEARDLAAAFGELDIAAIPTGLRAPLSLRDRVAMRRRGKMRPELKVLVLAPAGEVMPMKGYPGVRRFGYEGVCLAADGTLLTIRGARTNRPATPPRIFAPREGEIPITGAPVAPAGGGFEIDLVEIEIPFVETTEWTGISIEEVQSALNAARQRLIARVEAAESSAQAAIRLADAKRRGLGPG